LLFIYLFFVNRYYKFDNILISLKDHAETLETETITEEVVVVSHVKAIGFVQIARTKTSLGAMNAIVARLLRVKVIFRCFFAFVNL
jgi:hypothetical protein